MRLKNSDYITILKYYDIDAQGMRKKDAKRKAEDLLANKLCRCIKRVDNKDEPESRAIAICKSSILLKKGRIQMQTEGSFHADERNCQKSD